MKAHDVELAKELLDTLKNLRAVQNRSLSVHGNLRLVFTVPISDCRDTAVMDAYPKGSDRLAKGNALMLTPILEMLIADVIRRLKEIGVEP